MTRSSSLASLLRSTWLSLQTSWHTWRQRYATNLCPISYQTLQVPSIFSSLYTALYSLWVRAWTNRNALFYQGRLVLIEWVHSGFVARLQGIYGPTPVS